MMMMMIKKLTTAILPVLLVAQLPISASKFVPTEWIKSFQYGLKWTELMMNGYPGSEAEAEEPIPEGKVTTTVILSGTLPEIEDLDEMISPDQELCEEQKQEFEKATQELIRVQFELEKERLVKIKTVHVL